MVITTREVYCECRSFRAMYQLPIRNKQKSHRERFTKKKKKKCQVNQSVREMSIRILIIDDDFQYIVWRHRCILIVMYINIANLSQFVSAK